MPYTPTNWVDGVTPVNEANMDKLEGGLAIVASDAATALANHAAAADPHTGYATDADLTAHVAAADPHTGYQKESEKGVANGYAGLDSGGLVPAAQLPAVAPGVPAGVIADFGGSSAPTGWLICDGASVLRGDYPALFTAIGTTWGSVDGTHFTLPNLKGRTTVGRDAAQTEFDVLAELGGVKSHALAIAELPSHNHGGASGNAGYHAHNYFWVDGGSTLTGQPNYPNGHTPPGQTDTQWSAGTDAAPDHAHSIPAQGSGTAHPNLQPYAVTNKIIKT